MADLFEPGGTFPAGFKYQPDFLSLDEERELLERFGDLPFEPFQFGNYVGNRRVVSFGWRYDFVTRGLHQAAEMPAFLLPLRDRAALLAARTPADLQHVLLTEYAAGAGIGWHKDKADFGEVVGISLLSACRFRLRRKRKAGWDRVSLEAEPRSAYLLSGTSRTEWEHSIPAVETLRYSITFRSLRAAGS